MATTPADQAAEPKVHPWTRDEYYKMGESGLFDNMRVELVEGRVIEMRPINSQHATAVTLADDAIRKVFGAGWTVRVQSPLALAETSAPQPDLAVVAGNARDYKTAHPATAALVIEVADTSLAYDRGEKGSLYARAGIADYWIINLQDSQVEVYRHPMPMAYRTRTTSSTSDASPVYGYGYTDVIMLTAGNTITPLAGPGASIDVADLLP